MRITLMMYSTNYFKIFVSLAGTCFPLLHFKSCMEMGLSELILRIECISQII